VAEEVLLILFLRTETTPRQNGPDYADKPWWQTSWHIRPGRNLKVVPGKDWIKCEVQEKFILQFFMAVLLQVTSGGLDQFMDA
jgi:hypothetical protein